MDIEKDEITLLVDALDTDKTAKYRILNLHHLCFQIGR